MVKRESLVRLAVEAALGVASVDSIAGMGVDAYLKKIQDALVPILNGIRVKYTVLSSRVELSREEGNEPDEVEPEINAKVTFAANVGPKAEWSVVLTVFPLKSEAVSAIRSNDSKDLLAGDFQEVAVTTTTTVPAGGREATRFAVVLSVELPSIRSELDDLATRIRAFLAGARDLFAAAAGVFKARPDPDAGADAGDAPADGDDLPRRFRIAAPVPPPRSEGAPLEAADAVPDLPPAAPRPAGPIDVLRFDGPILIGPAAAFSAAPADTPARANGPGEAVGPA